MEIHSESRIHHPQQAVYDAYRDQLPEIAVYIDDISEINVVSREETGHGIKLHNEWVADTEIPRFASKFLRPEHMRWDDFADWHDDEHYVAYRLETRAFTEAVQCSGRNSFYADGEGATRVVLTGELQIDLSKVKGIPSFLGRKIGPQVEKFIVKLITPNLMAVNASLERFLDAQK